MSTPSNQHQWLVLWIARKMLADGYMVCGYHGPTPHGGPLNYLPIPPVLRSIRPDVLAIRSGHNAFAIGEAKTSEDLYSDHSQRQLKTLGALLQVRNWSGRIYIAVPHSAVRTLDAALAKASLAGSNDVRRLHIPDCLIPEDSAVVV